MTKMTKMNKIIVFLLLANFSFSQSILKAKIKSVEKDGLHLMKVPSLLRSYSNEDLGNLRIYDSKNQEIPYFIYANDKNITSENFEVLKLNSKLNFPNQKTEVIFENSNTIKNNFLVEFANTEVLKKYEILGSDNLKDWFGLINKDSIYLQKANEKTSIFYNFSIPLSNYKYIKLSLDDRKTLPVNVLNVGIMKFTSENKVLDKILPKNVSTTNDNVSKNTIVKIDFQNKEIFHQISFSISNPKLYQRNAVIYTNEIVKIKNKTETVRNELAFLELISLKQNTFLIPSEKFVKQIFIEIDNQDNIPLTIDDIVFYQKPISIVSELKPNENYTIETGNPELITPNYDLKYFENIIDNNFPKTEIYDIQNIAKNDSKNDSKNPYSSIILWLCIGVGAVVALYFVSGMLKEMK